MNEAERIRRHDAERARFGEEFGPAYAAWLAAQPPVTPAFIWTVPVANDDTVLTKIEAPANDNRKEAA